MGSAIEAAADPAARATPWRAPRSFADRLRATHCAVLIVHYRDAAQTLACIESMRAVAPDVPVLVVDNDGATEPQAGLADGCARAAAALLVVGRNAGFGGGNNAGIDALLAACPAIEHVLLLNPDARATPGLVERLRATARAHPDAGIVGATVLSADGRSVQFANGRLRPWTLTRQHVAAPPGQQPFRTTFVTGAVMLLDGALLRDGLRFDERFFLYAEDLDLCCEVRARGRSLWIDPLAVVRHEGGGTWHGERVLGRLTAQQVYWLARSKATFARKRLPWPQRLVALAFAAFVKPLAGLALARSPRFLGPHWRGLRDGCAASNR